MNEKAKAFLLRLPEKVHTWLKENVKDVSVSDFIVSLITEKIENVKRQTEKSTESQYKPNPLINKLIWQRSALLQRQSRSKGSLTTSVRNINEKWTFRDAFEYLEKEYFDFAVGGVMGDILEALINKIGGKSGEAWKNYFEPARKMSPRDQCQLYDDMRNAERRERCHGDPNEVVWKGITREDIYYEFETNKNYSVSDIAAGLGLNYMQVYLNIVPWMKREGFKIA